MGDGCVTELPFEIQLEGEVQVTLKEIKFLFLSSYFFEICLLLVYKPVLFNEEGENH